MRCPPRWLPSALALACAIVTGPVRAQVIQEYAYAPDRIYPVRTGLGITTQIELSPSEKIVDFSTGFSSGWELTRRDNVFYLKPRNVDVDTNLLIRTATHAYIFELRVVATDWKALDQAKQAGVQYKVRFTYPNDTEFAANTGTRDAAQPDGPQPAGPQPGLGQDGDRRYNFDYDYSTRSCQRWLVPAIVYDDGQFTYLRMSDVTDAPTGDFPAVFAREHENGEDMVVNTTIQGSTVIVHGTYPFLVIRHGSDVVGLRRNRAR